MTSTPEISVVIPAYNAARYLPETVAAVLGQTMANWELVIVDNASTDSTPRVIEELVAKTADLRIRVFRNTRTVPAPDNWNIAVSHARAGFIKLVCADDVLALDGLERQCLALNKYPTASVATSTRTIVNSKGRRLFDRNCIGRTGLYPGRRIIRRCIMAGTNIIGEPVNVTWRRAAIDKIGVFDPEIAYATDAEYWLRLLGVGDLFFDSQPVGTYRIHSDAATTRLAAVTVEDFLRTARKQAARGMVDLSPLDVGVIRAKSWLKSKARQAIYKMLG